MVDQIREDKSVPKTFYESNRSKKERVEKLAEQAAKKLENHEGKITEKVFLDATKEVDPEGKGISHSTIFRNEKVKEILAGLLQLNQREMKKHEKKKPSRSKRSKTKALRDKYSEKSKLSLIEELEKVKSSLEAIQKRQVETIEELNAAKKQNTNQLVMLTKILEFLHKNHAEILTKLMAVTKLNCEQTGLITKFMEEGKK